MSCNKLGDYFNNNNFDFSSNLFGQLKKSNFYKKQNICKGDYTCDACKYITKIMNHYLPAEIIKKLIERDL